MNVWDVVILIAVAGMIGGAVALLVRSRKRGSGCCGGGCSGCSGNCAMCSGCGGKEKQKNDE